MPLSKKPMDPTTCSTSNVWHLLRMLILPLPPPHHGHETVEFPSWVKFKESHAWRFIYPWLYVHSWMRSTVVFSLVLIIRGPHQLIVSAGGWFVTYLLVM